MKLIKYSELSEDDVTTLVKFVSGYEELDPIGELIIVESTIKALVNHLDRKARNDVRDAGASLGRVAIEATESFQRALLKQPDWFKTQFLETDSIPVMFSNRKSDRDTAQRIIDLTSVGQNRNIETTGKQIHSDTSTIAEHLYKEVFSRGFSMEALCVKCGLYVPPEIWDRLEAEGAFLPKFSKDKGVQKLWWHHCHEVLKGRFGENFEEAEVFRSYWKRMENRGLSGNAKKNEIRKRIRKDLQQGLRALAREP